MLKIKTAIKTTIPKLIKNIEMILGFLSNKFLVMYKSYYIIPCVII